MITLHIGQAGNQIGENLWDLLSHTQGIDKGGMKKDVEKHDSLTDLFFYENEKNLYHPRTVFADLDRSTSDKI